MAFWDNSHYPFWDLRSTDLKIFLGYDIKYLSLLVNDITQQSENSHMVIIQQAENR